MQSESCSTVECIYYTHSIWKSISVFHVCITLRSSFFSLQRFFIIYAKLMDYLRFGKARAGFVCLLFSPWRLITQALVSMDLLLSMTSPPYFVYFSRITQLSQWSGVQCFQKYLRPGTWVVNRKEHISSSVIHDLTVLADLQNPFHLRKVTTCMYLLSFAAFLFRLLVGMTFLSRGFHGH